MKKFNIVLILMLSAIYVYHLTLSIYFFEKHSESVKLSMSNHGSLNSDVGLIHFLLFITTLLFSFLLTRKSLAARIGSVITGILALFVYRSWYLLTHTYIRVWELKPENPKDQIKIEEIGYFVGSVSGDYAVFVVTVFLTLFAVAALISKVGHSIGAVKLK
ncbi:MAG: hypothetical protein KIS76_01800 [Pyrinomonadaceae bacterium]|nr:hypothetical protein [Pyrinomonadaceae bacterium]